MGAKHPSLTQGLASRLAGGQSKKLVFLMGNLAMMKSVNYFHWDPEWTKSNLAVLDNVSIKISTVFLDVMKKEVKNTYLGANAL